MSWFIDSHLHLESFPQVVPRWKQCVLQTERGFEAVLKDLLRERTAHGKVSSHFWDLRYSKLKGMSGLFKVGLYEVLIQISPLLTMDGSWHAPS